MLFYWSKIIITYNTCVSLDSIHSNFQYNFNKINYNLFLNKSTLFGIYKIFFFCQSPMSSLTCSRILCFIYNYLKRYSHIGPLFFLLFINDLPLIFGSSVEVHLFVNDVITFPIRKSHDQSRTDLLFGNVKFVFYST